MVRGVYRLRRGRRRAAGAFFASRFAEDFLSFDVADVAVELLPEVRVTRERLRALFPDELQRMTQAELMHDLRPIELRHPQRIGAGFGLVGRGTHAIAHFSNRASRAFQRSRNLSQAATLRQSPLDLCISIHRELPPRHCDPVRLVQNRRRYRARPSSQTACAGGPNPRKSGGSNFRKSGGPHPRKSGGPNQRKFCTDVLRFIENALARPLRLARNGRVLEWHVGENWTQAVPLVADAEHL